MILTIIGARPQFIKAALLSDSLKRANIKEFIVHTGQHYDYKMSGIFFDELNLKGADINLNVGSGNHGVQTATMLTGLEKIMLEKQEDVKAVLLYGDTNSTLAGALAASKLSIRIIHVESGLRSFNREMPEEINRIVTDHVSNLLFCPSETSRKQLESEGITNGVFVVGDIMLDAFNLYGAIADSKIKLSKILPPGVLEDYILLTIHRPVNTDNSYRLQQILNGIGKLKREVIWPIHPRSLEKVKQLNLPRNLHLCEPFSYLEMSMVLRNSHKVITDSGGLQKEAYWAKKPCITIRSETEWIETLEGQWNILTTANCQDIVNAVNEKPLDSSWKLVYGDGHSADQMTAIIKAHIIG